MKKILTNKINEINFQNLPLFFANLNGWRKSLLAFLLGITATFGLPPSYFQAAFIFAGIIFFWLCFGAKTKYQIAAVGFCFGCGFYAAGLWWVNNAILSFTPHLIGLVPVVCFGFGIWGGAFVMLAALIAAYFKANRIAFVLVFASCFMFGEWLRSWLFTGFSWNLVASIAANILPVMQSLAFWGSYGLSFIIWLVIGLLAVIPLLKTGRQMIVTLGAIIIIGGLVSGFGIYRLANAEESQKSDVKLRLVQPALYMGFEWTEEKSQRVFNEYVNLSLDGLQNSGVTYVIWGETASPFALYDTSRALNEVLEKLPEGVGFISGTVRKDKISGEVYNSSILVDPSHQIIDFYDKSHLVPFGEYVPLRGIVPLEKFTAGGGDFMAGSGVRSIAIPVAGKVGILICYEVIFPSEVKDKNDYPDWFLNLTFDGWYGDSFGPYQHFVAAQMRAIEEGIPLVRVAATGISGVISPYGKVIASLGLGEKGVLDAPLPLPIKGLTLYAKYGNVIPMGMGFLALIIAFMILYRASFRKKP